MSAMSKKTINILIGPFTLKWAQNQVYQEYDWHDPKLITDMVEKGTFHRDNLAVYKHGGW